MVVRVDVRPELFEWARARSGIGDDVWDHRFPRYQVWLSGLVSPTVRQLSEFARRTYTPVGYFLLDEPPREEVPIPDFRTKPYRSDARVGMARPVSGALLDTIYACQARQEWFRDHQLLNGETPIPFVGKADLETPIVEAAAEMRAALAWTEETRRSLRSRDAALALLRENAEETGVLVMVSGMVGSNTHRKLDPDEFRGFALVEPYAPLVFVNGADAKSAQVFTLAHELAHLWLGETALSDLDTRTVESHRHEVWCNRVAAELLAPMLEVRSVFDTNRGHRDQVQALAARFRVSTQVILGRLREAGVLTWDQYMTELRLEQERVGRIVRGSGGGDYYKTKPVQVSKRFARGLISSALEGHTTYAEAHRLLGVAKASTFRRLGEELGVA